MKTKTATKTGKAKTSQIKTNQPSDKSFDGATVQTGVATEIVDGSRESAIKGIVNDTLRADNITPPSDIAKAIDGTMPRITDLLTTASKTWNSDDTTPIDLRGERNVLAQYEVVPTPLIVNDKVSRYQILTCSDNGLEIGKPFNPKTYSVLNNDRFIAIIETIGAVLDKMGLKWIVATTGTLMERERQFISIQILNEDNTETVIEGREFKGFLNALNSIPSSSGCTVTFANNTFCVCCANTFAAILHNKDGAKLHVEIKHSKNMNIALGDVPTIVEAYFSGNKALFKNLKAFSEFPLTVEEAELVFAAFVARDIAKPIGEQLTDKENLATRSANIVQALKELHVNGRGNKGKTTLDAFQAVTEFYTHFSAGKSEDTNKQFQSSEIGSGATNKREFYQWLIMMIQDKSRFQAVAKVGDTLLVNYRKTN